MQIHFACYSDRFANILIPKKQDGVNCPNEVELGCWGGAHDSLIANVCVLKNVRLKLKLKLISKLEKSMGALQLLLDSGLFYSAHHSLLVKWYHGFYLLLTQYADIKNY